MNRTGKLAGRWRRLALAAGAGAALVLGTERTARAQGPSLPPIGVARPAAMPPRLPAPPSQAPSAPAAQAPTLPFPRVAEPDSRGSAALPTVSGCAPEVPPLFGPDGIFAPGTTVLLIDLPTALRVADAKNPTIGYARARVDEAYVRVDQADLKWIPDFQIGGQYLRHDGNYQSSAGIVSTTSKNSLEIFGGPTLSVSTADALFAPLIARRLADAASAASQAVANDTQLQVAGAYLVLLRAYGQLAVNADILARDREVLRLARGADRAGLAKTGADLPRMQTQYQLDLEQQLLIRGQIRVASARLARLLLLQPAVGLVPAEPAIVPITLIPEDGPIEALIDQALRNRPEQAESQALVAASQVRLRQARLEPLLPSLQVSSYGGAFGGGQDAYMGNFQARSDETAQAVWTLKNLGIGNRAEIRLRGVQVNEAGLHALEVSAQVTDEVTEAVQIAQVRRQALVPGQEAIRRAREMFHRLYLLGFLIPGQKEVLDSLEPLLAIQALSQAQSQYLDYVIDYNWAQFQLFTAVGLPPLQSGLKCAAVPLEVSPVPATYVPAAPGAGK